MNLPRDPSGASLSLALRQVVRKDLIVKLTVAAFAVLGLLHVAPFLTADTRAALRGSDAVDIPFFALIMLACWVGLSRLERRGEQRFWILLSVAYGSWMLAVLVTVFLKDTLGLVSFYLVLETSYAVYYTVFVLAITGKPHLSSGPRATSLILSLLTTAALIFGLFVYFVLIPGLLKVQAYESSIPSANLYLLLDAFLAVWLTALARRVDSRRWRRLYSLLALTAVMTLVNDVQYSELLASGVTSPWGVPGALVWALQFVIFVLAARLRHVSSATGERPAEKRRSAPRFAQIREQTLAIAVAFPGVHFALYALGALDEAIRPARETSMLVWLLLMATVAIIQHRLLEASRRSLEQNTSSLGTEISERRELESQHQGFLSALERKKQEIEEKNAELERFTYVASHDLRSPLITIQGFLGVVERKLASGGAGQISEPLKRVDVAAGKMWRLLDELLELQRIGREAGEARGIPTRELVGEVVENLAGAIGECNVAIEISPDLPVVRADRTRLLEVWQNLIENAVKYMGGQDNPRIEVGCRKDDGHAVLYVRDNGRGIEPADQARIFKLFHRLDQDTEGTGVGLALAKRIVEQHGGRIWVESEGRGRGATFCFTLGS